MPDVSGDRRNRYQPNEKDSKHPQLQMKVASEDAGIEWRSELSRKLLDFVNYGTSLVELKNSVCQVDIFPSANDFSNSARTPARQGFMPARTRVWRENGRARRRTAPVETLFYKNPVE